MGKSSQGPYPRFRMLAVRIHLQPAINWEEWAPRKSLGIQRRKPPAPVWHMFTPGVLGTLWDQQICPCNKRCMEAFWGIGKIYCMQLSLLLVAAQLPSCAEESSQQRRICEDIFCSWFLTITWLSMLSSETNPGAGLCCGTLCRSRVPTAVFFPCAEPPELLLSSPGTACCNPQTSSSQPSTRDWGQWDTHRDPRTAWTGADR